MELKGGLVTGAAVLGGGLALSCLLRKHWESAAERELLRKHGVTSLLVNSMAGSCSDGEDLCAVNYDEPTLAEAMKIIAGWRGAHTFRRSRHPSIFPLQGVGQVANAAIQVQEAYMHLRKPCFMEYTMLEVKGTPIADTVTAGWLCDNHGGKPVKVKTVVACTFGNGVVEAFTGVMSGTVVKTLPNTSKSASYEMAICPERLDRPLGALSITSRSVVGPRVVPYLRLGERLQYGRKVASGNVRQFYGMYEVHLTARANDAASEEVFKTMCKKHGVKYIQIVLPAGSRHATQPMCGYYTHKVLFDALRDMYLRAKLFVQAGVDLTRLKMELQIEESTRSAINRRLYMTEGDTGVVPMSDSLAVDPGLCPSSNYFEFHLKLRVPPARDPEQPPPDIPRLQAICKRQQAHVSRNAFKAEKDGMLLWFVTQRLYNVGYPRALEVFLSLVSSLKEGGFNIVAKHREYAVYDSNVALDKGWIEPLTPSTPVADGMLIDLPNGGATSPPFATLPGDSGSKAAVQLVTL